MTFSILPGVALLILTFLAPIALAQGPENRGYGVIDPSLTGTRPGYSQDQVTYWAPNDDSYVNPDHFRQQMLDLHNQYRREHGAAAVTWDLNLVRSSQAHVDTCVYAHSVSLLAHSPPPPGIRADSHAERGLKPHHAVRREHLLRLRVRR